MEKKKIIGELVLFVSFILFFIFILSYLNNNTNFFEQAGKLLIENKSTTVNWQTILAAILGFFCFILGFGILGKGIRYLKDTWLLIVLDVLSIAPLTLFLLAVFWRHFFWWFRALLIIIALIFYTILRVTREDVEKT